jgi:hypothetical protein
MATASVLIAAEAHCKANKSRAADAVTSSVRAAQYLLTNTVNRVVSAMELSDQQAALTALGHPADLSSTHFWTCSVGAAMKHVRFNADEEVQEDANEAQDAAAPGLGAAADFIDALEFDAAELGDDMLEPPSELYVERGEAPKTVQQHIHYALRGDELAMLSLHDYCRLISVKPLTKKGEEQRIQQQQQQQQQQHRRPGRQGNKTFFFEPEHPLHGSHVQSLRSKHCTVLMQPPPPRMPELQSAPNAGSRGKAAVTAAAYYLTLLRPWSATNLPSLSYENWAGWCAELAENPTVLNRYRLAVMTSMSHGMASDKKNVEAARAYRFRNATRWKNTAGRDGTENPPGRCPNAGPDGGAAANDASSAPDGPLSARAAAAVAQLQRLVGADRDQIRAVNAFQQNAAHVDRTVQQACALLPRVEHSAGPARSSSAAATSAQVRSAVACCNVLEAFMKSDVVEPAAAVREDDVAMNRVGISQISWPSIEGLTPSQKTAVLKIRTYLPAGTPPPPFSFIALGGPGCGKSFFIEHLHRICSTLGVKFRSAAPAAVAAVPIGGQTLHSLVRLTGTLSADRFPQPPSADTMRTLRAWWNGVRLLVIDEISMVSQALLACVSRRLSEIMGNNAFFGGLVVVLAGDFDQLLPVPPPSLAQVAMGVTAMPKPGSPAALAREIFRNLDLCPVTEQMRCTDADWNSVLNDTRSSGNLKTMAANLKVLSASESENDPEWAFATIATNGNDVRLRLNWLQSERWSKHTGTVLLCTCSAHQLPFCDFNSCATS